MLTYSLTAFNRGGVVVQLLDRVRLFATPWTAARQALSMPANLENSAAATGLEKVSFTPIPKKGNAKECSNYHTIALISHTSKITLKILQARLQ